MIHLLEMTLFCTIAVLAWVITLSMRVSVNQRRLRRVEQYTITERRRRRFQN